MKAKEYPLMCKFIHGAFRNNSGGTHEYAQEVECVGTRDAASRQKVRKEWIEAEAWLKEFLGPVCDGDADVLRHAFWLGAMADDAYAVHSVPNERTDKACLAMPFKILNRYY